MSKSESFENGLMYYVFILGSVLVVIISGYQSFIGYHDFLGFNAVLFSAALSIFLFTINLEIRKRKVNDQGIFGVFLALVLVVVFSFMGNFNAIYKQVLGDKAKIQYQTNSISKMLSNLSKAELFLLKNPEYEKYAKFKKEIDSIKQNVLDQITDDGNMGFGRFAREETRKAEHLLKVEITPNSPPKGSSRSKSFWESYANSIVEKIESHEKIYIKANYPQWGILTSIKELRNSLMEKNPEKKESFNGLILRYGQIKSEVHVLTDMKLMLDNVDVGGGGTLNIADTFRTAFIQNFSIYTIVAALVSLMLDLLIPLLIILTAKKEDANELSSDVHDGGLQKLKDKF